MAIDPGHEARRKLLERERAQALRTVAEFKKIQQRISAELRDVLERIEKTRRTEGNASAGQLVEQARLRELFDQVSDEIFTASIRLGLDTSNLQRRAIDIAKSQAAEVAELRADLDFFDSAATREVIGLAGDGEPLQKHFAGIAKPIRQRMFDALFYGVGTGKPNSVIAQEINSAVEFGAARAMTITRTETNRAYREATRKFYNDVPAVVGWQWLAALDLTTCPICWSMHGKIFKTKTVFASHPNCRCTMVPIFRGDPKPKTGPKLFQQLTIEQQRAILGPRRLELYNQGADLTDFVVSYKSAFGPGRALRVLADIKFKANPRTPAGSAAGPPRVKPPEPGKTVAGIPQLTTPDAALSTIAPKPGDPVPYFSGPTEATEYFTKRYPGTVWDFDGFDVKGDILQKNANEIARLMDRYPETAERLKYFGTYRDKTKVPRRSAGRFPKQEYGHCAWTGEYIAMNPKIFGDADLITAKKKRGREIGWSASEKTWSTTTHEFGHAVDSWLDANGTKSLFDFYTNDGTTDVNTIKQKLLRKFKPKPGEQSDYSISERGRRQRAEQFAEGFSMFWNRDESEHSRFATAQAKFIDLVQNSAEVMAKTPTAFRNLSEDEKKAARAAVNELYKSLGLTPPYAKKLT